MPDVFISYSTKDSEVANIVCAELEKKGIACWIAPRNIPAGGDWMSTIIEAIKTCKIFLVIYSANSAQSNQVPREVAVAISEGNYIIPYKIDNTPFSGTYEYSLATCHWIQASPSQGIYKTDEIVASISVQLSKVKGTYIENYTVNNISASNVNLSGGSVNVAPQRPTAPPVNPVPPVQQIPQQQQLPKKEKKSHGCLTAFIVVLIVLIVFGIIGSVAASCVSKGIVASLPNASHTDIDGDGYEMERFENCYYFPNDFNPKLISNEYLSNYADLYYGNNSKQCFTVGSQIYYSGAVLRGTSSESYIEIDVSKYDLEGFAFYYGHTPDSARGDVEIHIYADNVEIGTPVASWGSVEKLYTYNLTKNEFNNAEKIMISVKDCKDSEIGIGNLLFFEKDGKPTFSSAPSEISDKVVSVPSNISSFASYNAKTYSKTGSRTFEMGGTEYSEGIVLEGISGAAVAFATDGKYNGMQFTIGRVLENSDNPRSNELTVNIYLNGRENPSETITVKWDDVPEVFNIRFSDYPYMGESADFIGNEVKQVYIELENNDGGAVGITDLVFYGTREPSSSSNISLSSTDAYAGKGIEPYCLGSEATLYNGYNADKSITIGDTEYSQGIVLVSKSNKGVAMFNTNNKYSVVNFKLGCVDDENVTLVVTIGDEATKIEVTPDMGAIECSFDLRGGEIANVSFYAERGTVGIVDLYFSGK